MFTGAVFVLEEGTEIRGAYTGKVIVHPFQHPHSWVRSFILSHPGSSTPGLHATTHFVGEHGIQDSPTKWVWAYSPGSLDPGYWKKVIAPTNVGAGMSVVINGGDRSDSSILF